MSYAYFDKINLLRITHNSFLFYETKFLLTRYTLPSTTGPSLKFLV
jgi:hypothetical protein